MADRDQSHLDATRAQVNEVQNIMKNNVDKIMEREGKLSDLEGRADQLQASFKTTVGPRDTRPQAVWTLIVHVFEFGPFEMHEFML